MENCMLEDKNVKISGQLDFSNIKTFPVKERVNLVTIENLSKPGIDEVLPWGNNDFNELVDSIVAARKDGKHFIWSMGAHVIKNGLSRYIIELMKRGIITHVSGNGAVSIHDFELSFNGGTSENVPRAIEDGSFGMWEETGRWMNEALITGAEKGLGYGESLAVFMDENPAKFPYREDCVIYQAYKNNVAATYHIALGTDIIHQHPAADFKAIGAASGVDFHKICYAVSRMDNGVFVNFGSGVIGPEVFLKALSISRNLGYKTSRITTANFDLTDLGDYKKDIGYDDPNYYYRPRKNIVNRPTSLGGKGWHFCGDHKVTIPNLYKKIIEKLPNAEKGIK
jgi:hypothetical protein